MVKFKSVSISGFGGGYEDACQRMLWLGMEWIKDKNKSIWVKAHGYDNGPIQFYGIYHTEGQLKDLEKIWDDKIDDYTGAMHQAVMQHLRYIHENGYEKWLKYVCDHRKEEPITVNIKI